MSNNNFQPEWRTSPPKEKSFRSIFKWGAPDRFKHPNEKLYKLIKETFNLNDEDFKTNVFDPGDDSPVHSPDIKINDDFIKKIEEIVSPENIDKDIYSRVKYSNGKTLEEALDLRNKKIADLTDIAVHPKNKEEVKKIVEICDEKKIPVHVFAGGSSVTLGHKCPDGGVTLVLSTHMNRVVDFNETDQTIVVQPGIFGPELEKILNNAPETLNSKRKYTCGHFPQSFEYSTAGGWVITLGSGQASTYYGDAKDLVISQEYITPSGTIITKDYPATAAGPDIGSIFLGSEGVFGILVELKIKVFRYMPENRKNFSFIFPTWEDAVEAAREISQSEGGFPAVMRISDPEETHVALKLYGIDGTPLDKLMSLKGFKPMERCLCLGNTEGNSSFSKAAWKNVKKTAKQFNGMYLTGYPTKKWEHGRFEDPYMREDLNDYGIYIDTLETSVKWSNLHKVHTKVRKFIKERPETICMTHSSHFYPQGTNLYFIFIARFESNEEYLVFQREIIKRIEEAGGSLSHHHGIGKMMAGLFEKHIGENEYKFLRAVKNHFDKNSIMNSRGILGFK